MQRAPRLWQLIGLALLLWGGEYACRTLWEPDEARYAYVAREMRETGNWAVPHRHGEYYAHKPPLMFWLINAGASLTGGDINRISTRLPSLLGAILSLWAIANLARRMLSSSPTEHRPPNAAPARTPSTSPAPAEIRTPTTDNLLLSPPPAAVAWRAVLVLLTTYLFWNKGGMGQIDALLCGLELIALYHLFAYESDRRLWRPLLAYFGMGLAILAKGPVGFAVPFGMYLVSTFAARDGQRRHFAHVAWGPLLTLLLPAAWIAWVYCHHPPPGYLPELLFKQNIDRAAGELGHNRPFYYFLLHFPLEFLPWTLLWFFIPAAWRTAHADADPRLAIALRRLLAMSAFVVFFFSLSASKRELYILPAYPPAALAVALCWPAVARSPRAGPNVVRCWVAIFALGSAVAIGAWAVDLARPMLPLHGAALLVPALIALAGAATLYRQFVRAGRVASPAVLTTFAVAMLALQIGVGTAVYAGANALKSPHEVAAAADRYLAPDDPILLFRMNGEIMALYAGRPGRATNTADGLAALLRQHGHGLVVLEEKRVGDLPPGLADASLQERFRMGHKHLRWIYVPQYP